MVQPLNLSTVIWRMKRLLIYIPLSLALLLYLNTAVIGQNNYDYPDGHSFTIGDSLVEIELNWDDPEEAIVVFSVATKTEQAISILHPDKGIFVRLRCNTEICSYLDLTINGKLGRGGCRLEAPFPLLHLSGNSKHSFQIKNAELLSSLKYGRKKSVEIMVAYVLADSDSGLPEIGEFRFYREARQLKDSFYLVESNPCEPAKSTLSFHGYLSELLSQEE